MTNPLKKTGCLEVIADAHASISFLGGNENQGLFDISENMDKIYCPKLRYSFRLMVFISKIHFGTYWGS